MRISWARSNELSYLRQAAFLLILNQMPEASPEELINRPVFNGSADQLLDLFRSAAEERQPMAEQKIFKWVPGK
jgi:hypothetical protein